ncbi:MAG: hypothetical protein HY594_04770 [Candidatus Omnitrophica bacterium]|nr:hypothetical protein [Candidatus Omnitrophota bacterium]
MDVATQAIGRLRGEIRKFLCKEIPLEVLQQKFRESGLDITLAPEGSYAFVVRCPAAQRTPFILEVFSGLPKLYAVDPPTEKQGSYLIVGHDVECLSGILTELTPPACSSIFIDFPLRKG